jgi:hypothetical protein
MQNRVCRRTDCIVGQRPHGIARTVRELHLKPVDAERVLRRAKRRSRPAGCRAAVTHADGHPARLLSCIDAQHGLGDAPDLGVMDIGDLRDADAAVHQGRGNEIRQRELGLDDLRRPAFVWGAIELFANGCRDGGHSDVRNLRRIDFCNQRKLVPCGDGGVENGMLRPPARIGLETQLIAAEFATQIV